MKAIPTVYGGVCFRSRLEARWAAFFDLIEWSWLYEPIDLNGWIPDFQLRDLSYDGDGRYGYDKASYIHVANPFVEIKPFDNYKQFDEAKIKRALPKDALCLLLGFSPFFEMCEIGGDPEQWDSFSFYNDTFNKELWLEAGNLVQWKKEVPYL